MTVTVNVSGVEKDLSGIIAKLRQLFSQQIGKESLQKIGNEVSNMIKVRTRLGYGVKSDNTARDKLKPLKPATVKSRVAKKKAGELSSLTTPKRSALTETGQLLDSIGVISISNGRVTIGPKGARTGSTLTNEKLAEYVTEQGRPFNNLSDKEIKKLIIFFKREISLLIAKANI